MASQTPLATPSAKAHERVTGRWNRNIQVENSRDKFFYYLKQIFGTPAVWLLPLLVVTIYISRAALEISTWSFAAFTLIYIIADRFSKTREFIPYRFGSDFALLGFLVTSLLSTALLVPWPETIDGLAAVRWVFLAYVIIFGLDLFPGINRLFFLMIFGAGVLASYSIVQHFIGYDQIHGGNLTPAPAKENAYFQAIGFFSSPRIMPTLLAMTIPFPAAAYLFAEKRLSISIRYSLLPIICLLSLALFWSYQRGLWVAGFAGAIALAILQFRRLFSLFGTVVAFLAVVVFVAYSSPQSFAEQLKIQEEVTAATQRQELNQQLNAFSAAPILGNGAGSSTTEKMSRDYGSLYFQLLAESGILGLAFFFIFVLGSLLGAYRLLQEIPNSYYWHRSIVAGTLGSQVAFLAAGLHWPTLREPHVMYLFIFELAVMSYVTEQYRRGLVSDDYAL